MKRLAAGFVLLAAGALLVVYRVPVWERLREIRPEPLPEAVFIRPQPSDNQVGAPENTNTDDTVEENPLPEEMNLDVPFTSQAPYANWDLPYQEACEEAAALLVHRYWTHDPFDSPEEADSAIREIVAFEEEHYGSYKDTTADETARFIHDLWGYDVDIVADPTLDDIKREVANGYPVIVPSAGRMLGNPNYTGEGPIFHHLVVKGYTKNGRIITNDPGTRKGADYVYNANVILQAMHDWNGGDVANGRKVILIIRGE